MAWTGTIKSIEKKGSSAILGIEISGPLGTFAKSISVGFLFPGDSPPSEYVAWLKRVAIEWGKQIEKVYAFADAISPGASIDFTEDTIVEDPALTTLNQNMLTIRRLLKAQDAGIPLGAQGTTTLANAQSAASTTLLAHPEWIGSLDILLHG
jgi:hypothetical protein